jgi:hypothetical protein
MTNLLKRWSSWVLIIILAISFWIMFTVSRQESPIMDELAHIPAGYSYLKISRLPLKSRASAVSKNDCSGAIIASQPKLPHNKLSMAE